MRPEENKNFTGFIIYYDNGKIINERENFYSRKLKKKCATNWAEIDKERIQKIELVWRGSYKAHIDKTSQDPLLPYTTLLPDQWFFSHSGYCDLSTKKVVVVSRNIGYVINNICYIRSVEEATGIVRITQRAA